MLKPNFMHRTQISLEEKQYAFLLQSSRRQGISISELIRQLIEEYRLSQLVENDPLTALAGIAEGDGQAGGRDHDCFLHGKSA